MSDFTPGPWFWNERTESIGSPSGWVAAVGPSHRERKSDTPLGDLDADAHLIAAAPDLYEVCEAIDNLWADTPGPDRKDLIAVMKMAAAALRKARGDDEQ